MPREHPDSTPVTYGRTAKTMHWVVAALVAGQFVISYLMPHVGAKTTPGTLLNLHFSFGVVILVAMAIRLAQRLLHPVPLDMPNSPGWERRAAHATHLIIYAILLAGPILGWASASAHKLPVSIFGIVALPDIAEPKARWALVAGDIHTYLMWTLLALVILHALAALYHHYVKRDGVLRRMLPAP